MNELAKIEYQPLTPKFLSDRLSMLHTALETYGKPFGGPLVQAWMIAMTTAEVTAAEFSGAVEHWLRGESKFPTPSELIGWVKSQREDADTRAAIQALMQRDREVAAMKDLELAEKYAGWSIDDLRAKVKGLTAGIAKALPSGAGRREPVPAVEFTAEELAAADARAAEFQKLNTERGSS